MWTWVGQQKLGIYRIYPSPHHSDDSTDAACCQGSFANKLSSTISSASIQHDNLEGVGTLTNTSKIRQ